MESLKLANGYVQQDGNYCCNQDLVKILLVDDDEDDYIIIRDLLDEIAYANFELDWVDSYNEGFTSFKEARHDIYLLDYNLDKQTGIDLMREMIAAGCNQPIIILTGQDDYNIDVDAMNSGAFDYLIKGRFEPADIERTIRYAVSRGKIETILRENESKYKTILDNIDEFIYIKGLPDESCPFGRVTFISSRVKDIIGYHAEEVIKSSDFIQKTVHPDDYIEIKRRFEKPLVESSDSTIEYRIKHKLTNKFIWLEDKIVPQYDDYNRLIAYIGVVRDITDRRIFEEQLRHDALHDQLTGLPNRTLFMDRLKNAIDRSARRQEYQFAVLFIDLDRFKNINDVMGHLCGDKLLMTVAERLSAFVRPGDTVARMGGDEFTILLEEIAYAYDATFVADRIQDLLSTPIYIDNNEVFSTASIGIALSTTGYENPEDMLRDADTAMYKAKAEGRARYEVFDTEMHARAVSVLRLETDLRRAVDRNEFQVYYQPIFRLQDKALTSYEALIRWLHPEKGMISPVDFIPLAEETGLIVQIGQWVLRQACRQMYAWKMKYPKHTLECISVNLSARQFSQIDLIAFIDQTLVECGLQPHNLKLEITESVVMENAECINAILSQFKSMGIHLSMDDFGTGYSSLSYLHRLPIDTLKIDRSFIARMSHAGNKAEIVETIITLAHSMNLQVVAEGVETEQQLQALTQFGCEFAQGYYFSQPLPHDAAEMLLQAPSK